MIEWKENEIKMKREIQTAEWIDVVGDTRSWREIGQTKGTIEWSNEGRMIKSYKKWK